MTHRKLGKHNRARSDTATPLKEVLQGLERAQSSEMIFRIASIIIAKIAASMPHIPNQNTSDRMINNGFSVKRRASSMGVSDLPSCQSRGAGGSKAHHKLSKLSIAGIRKSTGLLPQMICTISSIAKARPNVNRSSAT